MCRIWAEYSSDRARIGQVVICRIGQVTILKIEQIVMFKIEQSDVQNIVRDAQKQGQ